MVRVSTIIALTALIAVPALSAPLNAVLVRYVDFLFSHLFEHFTNVFPVVRHKAWKAAIRLCKRPLATFSHSMSQSE
jgi:hypothetical protein